MKTRSEMEMLELIVGIAQSDDNIRAVVLEGSRAAPGRVPDPFQDFDIVYVVKTVIRDAHWAQKFGDLMVGQMPDLMGQSPGNMEQKFTCLMQFVDGNRIDLTQCAVDFLSQYRFSSRSSLLLDKDSRFPDFPAASEKDYLPVRPTAKDFFDCCNEYWWVTPYVAKGLWRGEIAYAKYHLDSILRQEVMKMLNWEFGLRSGFSENPGKFGKHFRRYLESELCDLLLGTYSDASIERTWRALEDLCLIFRTSGLRVAKYFNYEYPNLDDTRVCKYLERVRTLPAGALTIYES